MNEFIHRGKDKKEFVRDIFNDISSSYDFLNHFLSGGIDIIWRKKFIKSLNFMTSDKVLDVATGTGDVAFTIKKKYKCNVTGLDLSINMLNNSLYLLSIKKLFLFNILSKLCEDFSKFRSWFV